MNLRPRTDIQRREIAEAAGVTPALISYYFPDKWSLLEAAAHPIVLDYVNQVRELLASNTTHHERLKDLIRIYMKFNRENGYLLQYYISSIDRKGSTELFDLLGGAHRSIVNFFQDSIDRSIFRGGDAETMQSLIWGVCVYLSQVPDKQNISVAAPEIRVKLIEDQVGKITELLMNGIVVHQKNC